MKYFIITCIVFASCSFAGKAQTVPTADAILKEAYQQAAKENKNVFVMFHASWCGWCHKMDTSMNDPVCKDFFTKNYVIRHLVVDESKDKKALENAGANELKIKYHGDGQGIPFWLIFDKEGNLLADSKERKEGEKADEGENVGCPASEKEVNYFIAVLKKTSKITPAQLDIIKTRFRKNE